MSEYHCNELSLIVQFNSMFMKLIMNSNNTQIMNKECLQDDLVIFLSGSLIAFLTIG